jgi:hypothetical protein
MGAAEMGDLLQITESVRVVNPGGVLPIAGYACALAVPCARSVRSLASDLRAGSRRGCEVHVVAECRSRR